MTPADSPLLAVLRDAPRRFRMPALHGDAQAARAAGAECALAFAMEAARTGMASPALQDLFTDALANLIGQALVTGADPAFQAQVQRSAQPEVEAFARLAARAEADRRMVRAASDALAHPGKLRTLDDVALRGKLARLHELASQEDWTALAAAAVQVDTPDPGLRHAAHRIASHPALERLRHLAALRALPTVQQYLALCEQRGPRAGSDEAAAHGRASARAGDAAEDLVAQALLEAARWLDRHESQRPHRVVRSLRTPAGFPAGAAKAKDEWDAAIVRTRGDTGDIVLLAEVKASPAAATPDFGRLLRGLQRLAQADPQARYTFACAEGEVTLHGESLQALQPPGFALPPHVIYCCAANEARPPVLSAASRAVLLGEPASLAFARAHAAGATRLHADLQPVWHALTAEPRLRSALHQYDTAKAAREAMLHPADLLAALTAAA
ncbi:MAG: hypothetical protein EOO30_04460 [Comamonadaceae bacterium]|nr:MAG: hypothetical protein EOO30_04460 [Comamonadaceae bacterium]